MASKLVMGLRRVSANTISCEFVKQSVFSDANQPDLLTPGGVAFTPSSDIFDIVLVVDRLAVNVIYLPVTFSGPEDQNLRLDDAAQCNTVVDSIVNAVWFVNNYQSKRPERIPPFPQMPNVGDKLQLGRK